MPDDPKRGPLSVRLPDDQRAAIEAEAQDRRVSQATVVKWAVDRYLKAKRRK